MIGFEAERATWPPNTQGNILQFFDNFSVWGVYNACMKKCLYTLFAVLLLGRLPVGAAEKWSVHEWGTFTSLQDESGNAIGGINTDDEPVPSFVHRPDDFAVLSPTDVPRGFFKGAPSCHPDVTMRLETPVLYFHLPNTLNGIQTASVRVKFRGGWLSEFYPVAEFTVPGFADGRFPFGRLLPETESRLEWNNLQIGGDWPGIETSAHVWTSPRAVQAASVRATNGESEKFLFYRGVAHINAPLRVSHGSNSGELLFQSQLGGLPGNEPLRIRSLWLVDIQPDGKIAFRVLPPLSLNHDSGKYLTRTSALFVRDDFSGGNLEKLKTALGLALVSEGLFHDEAQALLNTWEVSYFKSPGLRLFFLVPRAWTDFYLPLTTSLPADLNRVMVGRIELVTPAQRNNLLELAHYPTNVISREAGQLAKDYFGPMFLAATNNLAADRAMQRVNQEFEQVGTGLKPLSAFVSIPKTYRTYLDLGRFRNALILDEAKRQPTEGLAQLIANYRLQAYQPPDPTGK